MEPPEEVSRRDFLALCGVLAASFLSCTLSSRTRSAAALLADPPLDDYLPVLEGLIRAVLPLEEGFPLSLEVVRGRVLSMFPIETETRFLGLQRTLVFFGQLDLFPHVSGPLMAHERIALDVPHRVAERDFLRIAAERRSRDEEAATRLLRRTNTRSFTRLPLDMKRDYLGLWKESEFTIKREFAVTVRSIIMVASYADDRTWSSIGYAGTTKGRPEYQRLADAKP